MGIRWRWPWAARGDDDTSADIPEGMTEQVAWAIGNDAGTDSFWGTRVPRELAYTVDAVERGVGVIAGILASLPLERRRGDELIPTGWLDQPEADFTYAASIYRLAEDLIFERHALWEVAGRTLDGWPAEVIRIDPEFSTYEYEPGTDRVVRIHATRDGRTIPERNLIRFDSPTRGLLYRGADAIRQAIRVEAAASRYAEPEIPTGVLRNESQVQLTDAEVQQQLGQWEKQRRSHNTAFLNRGVTYQAILSTPEQMQLIDARDQAAKRIARFLGLPPRYVAAPSGDSQTYSNVAHERRDLMDISLMRWINPIEQTLSMRCAPRGQTITFDMSRFLRPNRGERADIWQKLIAAGVMSRQEAREEEQLTGPAPEPPAPPQPPAPKPEENRPAEEQS